MMKDLSTPVPSEEFRKEVRACLHQAALVNYTRVSAYAGIEGAAYLFIYLFNFIYTRIKHQDLKKMLKLSNYNTKMLIYN